MPSASFKFGPEDAHEIKLVCGYLGKEQYFVDGNLVVSYRSFGWNEVRRFNALGHDIEIRVEMSLKGVRADGFVDGELKARNLFSKFNAKITQKHRGPPPMLKAAIWIVLALLFFAIFRAVDA
jgi:hypothetical protein